LRAAREFLLLLVVVVVVVVMMMMGRVGVGLGV
jgi:hypothetical protein